MVNATPPAALTLRKDPVPTQQEAAWAPQPAWTGAENFTPKQISIPRPSRRQTVTTPTMLSQPTDFLEYLIKLYVNKQLTFIIH